ncbi:MAG: nucleotide exchange factor GrpE, partial [Bacteriovoracaceae bacterium]|nr:nucleotide exchange factor GrpE [Bacteriovoracaceae bacterium]
LTKILGVIDNVERMIKEGFKNQAEHPLKTELAKFRTEILSKLSEYNVSPVESLNQKYNVDFHEAITTVPVPGKEPGTIIDVFENGYTIGTRLLRAARVVVAQ